MSTIPTQVLSEQLKQVINGRRVRTAVFTTFSFDPGFFELQILPSLFDQPFGQVDKIRRIQLEDALGSIDHLAVYYDLSALSQDAVPAQLDYRRIDVRRTTGCFHPKLVLLLVDEHPEDPNDDETEEKLEPYQALIVGTLSANLTRAGWWENIECAHFEQIRDQDLAPRRCPFRRDLVDLLRRVQESAGPGEDHSAMEQVRQFLLKRTRRDRFSVASHGSYFTRLFFGQQRTSFPDWLAELRLHRKEWNLEIISPYFDPSGAAPLERLLDVLDPRECRVYLPRDADGTAQVTADTYRAVHELAWWSNLPEELTARGRSAMADRMPPRRAHAKVYRLWAKGGRDLLIVGSVNLTGAGHSHAAAGNLEAAFLVDVTDEGFPRRWWLQPIEQEAERFVDELPAEHEGLTQVPFDLALRYDWGTGELAYRLSTGSRRPFELTEAGGRFLFRIDKPRSGSWVPCPGGHADKLRELLVSTSFVTVRHPRGTWKILVREENMAHRPSLLTRLTPEEILEYWALLTPAQRAAFIEVRMAAESSMEGISLASPRPVERRDTMFDRFAGIYHSFGCLRRHITEALDEGREREAEARLLGAKYDSLPSLLEKTLEKENGDPITGYVTFLCARQLRDCVQRRHRSFLRARRKRTGHLDDLLARLPEVRKRISEQDATGLGPFLDWYEPVFLRELRPEDRRP